MDLTLTLLITYYEKQIYVLYPELYVL